MEEVTGLQFSDHKERTLKKPCRNQNSDRISSLNDSILHYILSFLKGDYAVRTSVLSKRWQKLWISLPYLYFEEFNSTNKERFMNLVNNFLLYHDEKSRIIKFRLNCKHAADMSHIHKWISAVVRAGVQELDIYAGYIAIHNLPSCLSTCKTLVTLKLRTYGVWFPANFCLPNLKSLYLNWLVLSENFTSQLFNSRNLENLVLKKCMICSFTFQDLIADNPVGIFSNLKVATMDLYFCYPARGDYSYSKLIKKVPNVKVLHLSELCIKHLQSKEFLLGNLPNFCNLKHLELQLSTRDVDVGVMTCLLRHSPVLQSLHIKLFDGDIQESERKLMQEQLCSLPIPQLLKWIRMDNFRGSKDQVELVRFFLGNAQALEKIIVQFSKSPRKSPVLLYRYLLHLPKLSTNCVLGIADNFRLKRPIDLSVFNSIVFSF